MSGVLHRDISPWNILIVDSGKLPDSDRDDEPKPEIDGGILIDWDLSVFVDPKGPGAARRYERTVS
jgi:hypothetical protein